MKIKWSSIQWFSVKEWRAKEPGLQQSWEGDGNDYVLAGRLCQSPYTWSTAFFFPELKQDINPKRFSFIIRLKIIAFFPSKIITILLGENYAFESSIKKKIKTHTLYLYLLSKGLWGTGRRQTISRHHSPNHTWEENNAITIVIVFW